MTAITHLIDFLSAGTKVAGHQPFPRFQLSLVQWNDLVTALSQNDWALMSIWGEPREVHAAFYDETQRTVAVASLACPDGRFPSLSSVRPSAIRMERTIQDLVGLVSDGLTDPRRWLDHGQFHLMHPLKGDDAPATERATTDYEFLSSVGDGLHQIPVGPVHAGIIEPGHFRFTCNGETVVRLEERLGYVHKGIERHMQGKLPADAARVAARVSGDSTVAHSLAFARAVEAALSVEVSARAHWIRGVMAELERIANHYGDIGAICNDAAFPFMLAQCGILREAVLNVAHRCFGHRLMMDRVIPGGVTSDLTEENIKVLKTTTARLRDDFAPLIELYDNTLTLQDRTMNTGAVSSELVRRFAAGGYVGRASGRPFDARKVIAYPPYDRVEFSVPLYMEGDVNARVWVRIKEIEASLSILDTLLNQKNHAGPLVAALPIAAGEGMAIVEAFRGDILTWVRLDDEGLVTRCHPRDASWFQWPVLEMSIEGNIVADFPLCNKSFNCSYSGQDL